MPSDVAHAGRHGLPYEQHGGGSIGAVTTESIWYEPEACGEEAEDVPLSLKANGIRVRFGCMEASGATGFRRTTYALFFAAS